MQCKPQKEGTESEQFWALLGGKSEYPSEKIAREAESDPHLFSCSFSNGELKKFLERDFLLENLSHDTPIYVVVEGSEPSFFTRFFTWDSAKSSMHGNSFQRKLAIVKNGGTLALDKPKRRAPVSYGGRSSTVPDKSQRSRSVSFSPDRVRVRGRSPAFNALAATFENANARNLSTPPPVIRKLYPKSGTLDSAQLASRSTAIAAITSTFEKPAPARETLIPRSVKASPEAPKPNPDTKSNENSMSGRIEALTIQEDVKESEAEDEEGLPVYPYECLIISSTDPVAEIDVTKRETYLSSKEFREKFGMAKDAFYKLPRWKQNKLKMALQLF